MALESSEAPTSSPTYIPNPGDESHKPKPKPEEPAPSTSFKVETPIRSMAFIIV